MKVTHQARITIALGVLLTTGLAMGQGINSQTEFPLEPADRVLKHSRQHDADSGRSGLEIYITELDGETNLRRLTVNLHQDTFPAWSPDGKKLTFDSNRLRVTGEHINISDLWVMDSDGAQQTLLLSAPARRAGLRTARTSCSTLQLRAKASIKNDIGSALSDNDIFTLNIDDCIAGACSALNITNDSQHIDDNPDWSPDGSRIAFTSHWVLDTGQDSETAEIWTMNPDGSGRMQLTSNNEEERGPSWSPDGTKILYMCRALWLGSGTNFELCVMDVESRNVVVLTNNTTPDLTPNWTPDGSKIIFHRLIGGFNQLHSMNSDGTNVQQLTTPGHNLFPKPGYLRLTPGRKVLEL